MPSLPRVSFIVPVRNRTAELRVALASCLAQSFEDWEAVILDDHSHEPVEAVVHSFADPRFRYHSQSAERHGVAAARESAIALASTEILITLDGDDINQPQRAGRCLELLEGETPRLIYTRVRMFSSGSPHSHPKPVLQPFSAPLLEHFNYITNPGTAFNRAAYQAAGASYDATLAMAEDYDLYLRMSRAGVTIEAIDEEHVCYRKHADSTTAGRLPELHAAIMQVREKHAIPPFPLEAIAEHALPELSHNLLESAANRDLWQDDRWSSHGSATGINTGNQPCHH